MSIYTPDKWCLVSVPFPEGDEVKILAGWSGSYRDSATWRLSSGIISVELDGEYWVLGNHSGSAYRCHKQGEGLTTLTHVVLEDLVELHKATRIEDTVGEILGEKLPISEMED